MRNFCLGRMIHCIVYCKDNVCSEIMILHLGSGKTFTIEGGHDEMTRGIIPRATELIFKCEFA